MNYVRLRGLDLSVGYGVIGVERTATGSETTVNTIGTVRVRREFITRDCPAIAG